MTKIKGVVTLISNRYMNKGKVGLFGTIEHEANLKSAQMFVYLELLLFILSIILFHTVKELEATGTYMFFSVVLLVVSIIELIIIKKKEGVGNFIKWAIGLSFITSAITTTSTLGVGGSILFVFPILLSVQYCSLLYSIFISVITVVGSFVPLLLTSFLTFYDLNVIKLIPGSTIVIDTTLEAALHPEIIDEAGTKINELLAIFLPAISFVIIVAIVSCIITYSFRKVLLEQYKHFQNTRE